jgi:hypothetical protein
MATAAMLDAPTRAFYRQMLIMLSGSGIPVLLGGAYSFACYTGIERHTKDLDVFLRESDLDAALALARAQGLHAERTHPHWLAKVYGGDAYVDLIFNSANGLVPVDDEWFAHSVPSTALDLPVQLCPVEETIWSKAFVLDRERCDAADVAHLLRARADQLDWPRLLRRFGPHWRLLFAHLLLFGFVYPGEAATVPADVMRELLNRVAREQTALQPPGAPLCRGTLLSWSQYLIDVNDWGYRDARLPPEGTLTPEDIARWTAADK